ncbi:acyl-protein synthetase LuxE [Clostridium sp. UBA1056]|uniref:LuxE/PaaK family acyltransferase n=1 Tax=unclassified Clostridium TaxID=2614128 RepID=UPI003216FED4
MIFNNMDKLCNYKNAFDFSKDTEKLFLNAITEDYNFQLENQPYINHLCKKRGFYLSDISTVEDVFKIPSLFVGTMKINSFCNFMEEDIKLTLTSSGTNGQKTQLFLDKTSLDRLDALSKNTFESIGFNSKIPVHYFLFSYDIKNAENVGTSWSDEQILSLAPALSINWMIEWDNEKNEFYFDSEKWADIFVKLSSEAPVRLLGFPSFMYKMIEDIKVKYKKITVHEDSFIIAGGGWKNHLGKSMTLKEFMNYVESNIGLKHENIRDTYGMAEHGVPYCSCSKGHLHAPIYSRIAAVDPISLKKKDYGEEGLLQLITPYNAAQPSLSILSTDLAIIEKDCPCGLKGDYISHIRRGGISKHKGCAIAAQEILNK